MAKQKKDYSKLPKTRREQFDDVMHTDWRLIIKLSLLNLLFSLPLIGVLVTELVFIASLQDYTLQKVFPITLYMGLIAIIPFGIRGIGKFATASILKKRLYNEGFILLPRFFGYIKENALKGFLSYFMLGISYLVLTIGSVFFLYSNIPSYLKGMGIGVCVLYFILRYVATSYSEHFNSVYELGIFALTKNSFSFTIMNFISSLIYVIIAVIIPISLLFISYWMIIPIVVIYALFYDGFLSLIGSLYSISKFDKYINKENYPEFVNKGLRKENAEESENVEINTQENL